MPDRKNAIERELPEEPIETTSSDSYVARQYKSIRQEVEGTSGKVVDIVNVPETDILAPKSPVGNLTSTSNIEPSMDTQVSPSNLPIQITEVRKQLAVARNTDDKKAFEEIKRAA